MADKKETYYSQKEDGTYGVAGRSNVKLLQKYSVFNAGEMCCLPDAHAAKLVKAGAAVYVNPENGQQVKPKAKEVAKPAAPVPSVPSSSAKS